MQVNYESIVKDDGKYIYRSKQKLYFKIANEPDTITVKL